MVVQIAGEGIREEGGGRRRRFGVSSRRALLRLAPRGANFIEIDYRSCRLLRGPPPPLPLLSPITRCPSLECLSFPGCTYTIRTRSGSVRGVPFVSLLSPSRSPGKLIPVRPFALPPSAPPFRHSFSSLFDNGRRDRSLPSRWPFVLIREISLELRVKKGKGGKKKRDVHAIVVVERG